MKWRDLNIETYLLGLALLLWPIIAVEKLFRSGDGRELLVVGSCALLVWVGFRYHRQHPNG